MAADVTRREVDERGEEGERGNGGRGVGKEEVFVGNGGAKPAHFLNSGGGGGEGWVAGRDGASPSFCFLRDTLLSGFTLPCPLFKMERETCNYFCSLDGLPHHMSAC